MRLRRAIALACALLPLLAAVPSARAVVDIRAVGRDVWLCSDRPDARLGDILEAFLRLGVAVEVDPELTDLRAPVPRQLAGPADTLLDRLLGDLNYLLTWKSIPSPAGPIVSLKGIRVFREEAPGAARPLRPADAPVRILGAPGREYVAEDLLLGLRPGATPEQLRNLLVDIGGTLVSYDPATGALLLRLPPGADAAQVAAGVLANPIVAAAGPNWVYRKNRDAVSPAPATPRQNPAAAETTLPKLERPRAVAVLDEPMDPAAAAHLASRTLANLDAVPAGFPKKSDSSESHGSLMGLIASGDPAVYAGEPLAELPLVSVGIFDAEGRTTTYAVMQGLAAAAKNGAAVANLSWGTAVPSDFLNAAIDAAWNDGLVLVAAAGNDGQDLAAYYPAAHPRVLAVSALAPDGSRAPYSNHGPFVDASAPGDAVIVDRLVQGTSVSAALVSHQIALYRSLHPDASPSAVLSALFPKN